MTKYPENIRVYDDFLPDNLAQQLYSQIGSIPQQWYSLRKSTSNSEHTKSWWSIHGDKSQPARLDANNKMTYQYLATDKHQPGCDCTFCSLIKILAKNPPPEVSDDKISECFLSVYRPGDYLSQHHDTAFDRTWAFTYTLSTGWRPEWGGILNIQDKDQDWWAFPPKFNRLILMDVTEQNSSNHFVSEVIRDCPINRVTFSGWFTNPVKDALAA